VWEPGTSFRLTSEEPVIYQTDKGNYAIICRSVIAFLDKNGNETRRHVASAGSAYWQGFGNEQLMDTQGNIYVAINDEIISYDQVGQRRWKISAPAKLYNSSINQTRTASCTITKDDTVLVQYTTGELAELNLDGELAWYTNTNSFLSKFTLPVKINDNLYLVSKDPRSSARLKYRATLIAVDKSGTTVWERSFPGYLVQQVESVNSCIIANVFNGQIYCLEINGSITWELNNRSDSAYNYLHTFDGTIFIESNGNLTELDAEGNVSIRTPTENYGRDFIIHSDSIYYSYLINPIETRLRINLFIVSFKNNVPFIMPRTKLSLVRIENGEITKRWQSPLGATHGQCVGESNRIFLTNNVEGTVYCTRLE
jgi:hypothetical protein